MPSLSRTMHMPVLLALILTLGASSTLLANKSVETNIMLPMRDGIVLATDLYFPERERKNLPTLLIRTPYDKRDVYKNDRFLQAMVADGYVVAIQDLRGRFASAGRYEPGEHNRNDGYDTVEWLTSQSWSNQRLGTTGCSYLGEVQLVLAATRHPNHVAAFPMAPASGYYAPGRAWSSFDGGVFEFAQTAGWFYYSGSQINYGPPDWIDRREWFNSPAANNFKQTFTPDDAQFNKTLRQLPTIDALTRLGAPPSAYKKFAGSPPDGRYFRNMENATSGDKFNVPAVFVDGWYDYGPAETLQAFRDFRINAQSDLARDNQFIILTPATHCGYWGTSDTTVIGARPLGDSRIDLNKLQKRWFDHWLKASNPANFSDLPKVQYYLMGKNEWRNAEQWPIPGTTPTNVYLSSKGSANSRYGDGKLVFDELSSTSVDRFTYDPKMPVPTRGGQTCCTGLAEGEGSYDQSVNEMRHDVLVYSSEPLRSGMEVTGNIKVVLHVSSSAADTDFTAKLVDVYPDGRAFNIQEGALRMRYRKGLNRNVRMKQGKVYEVTLDLHATSNYFAAGHRIRLDVSSSNFPRWERNLNTGGNNYDETEYKIAKNAVHHGPKYRSRIVLPVIKTAKAQ